MLALSVVEMYITLSAALAALKNLPAVRDLPVTADDDFLSSLLGLSAGVNSSGLTVYRIYYVAAKYLQQVRSQHILSEGDGAKFTGLAVPIASLFDLQSSEDFALGLIVSPGFEVVLGSVSNRLFSTRSIQVRAQP